MAQARIDAMSAQLQQLSLKNSIQFSDPEAVGGYSQDANGKFHDGLSISYIINSVTGAIGADLNRGFTNSYQDTFSETKIFMDDLLRWIMKNKSKIGSLKGKFVSRRSALHTLMAANFETNTDWIVDVTLHDGTYYMCAIDTETDKLRKSQMTSDEKRRSYWGLKFEHFLTADGPESAPDADRKVNSSEGTYVVYKSTLGDHELIHASEVDGKDDTGFVELKTVKDIQLQKPSFKKYKLKTWYFKGKLAGIQKFLIGVINSKGIVEEMLHDSMDGIEKMCQGFWSPDEGYTCGDGLLHDIKWRVVKDDASIVYRIEHKASTGRITFKEMPRKSPLVFLPKWYTGHGGRPGTSTDVQ